MIPGNILIAEDQPHMRKIIKMVLVGNGFRGVIEAQDGNEAWDLLSAASDSTKPKRPDERLLLVICDWNMPGKTGLEILRAIRKTPALRNVPFIMLTSEASREHVVAALEEGVSDYLIKPFVAKDLEQKVRTLIQERWG